MRGSCVRTLLRGSPERGREETGHMDWTNPREWHLQDLKDRATWKAMRRYFDRGDMLKRLGLEERTPASDVFTGLGLFAVGVLVGAGLGLMFAPRRGDEMRQLVGDAWKNRGRAGQDFQEHMGVEGGLPPTSTGAGTSSH